MDRLISMSVFVTAVEEGSIAAAARRLSLSAVMAGRYLSALEEALSVRLLERSTHQLNLTDAGASYFVKAKRILNDIREAEQEATAKHISPQGSLRIAAPVTFGTLYLAPLIAAFMRDYPQVDIQLQLLDRFIDLVDEGVDLAIRIGQLPDSDLVARRITDYRLLACATPRYLAGAGMPVLPEDLYHHVLIGYSGTMTTSPWHFSAASGEVSQIAPNCRVLANNTGMMVELALQHAGIVYGPQFVVQPHLLKGDLVEVLPDYRCPVISLFAVTLNAKYVNTKTRLFIGYLQQALAPHKSSDTPPALNR